MTPAEVLRAAREWTANEFGNEKLTSGEICHCHWHLWVSGNIDHAEVLAAFDRAIELAERPR